MSLDIRSAIEETTTPLREATDLFQNLTRKFVQVGIYAA
jgi:hypothetical protein